MKYRIIYMMIETIIEAHKYYVEGQQMLIQVHEKAIKYFLTKPFNVDGLMSIIKIKKT